MFKKTMISQVFHTIPPGNQLRMFHEMTPQRTEVFHLNLSVSHLITLKIIDN